MRLVMCEACGHFVPAVRRESDPEPLEDPCPKCGETEFTTTSS